MVKKSVKKVPVTTRALIQRINRKLKPDEQRMCVTRGERWRGDLGDYYVINTNRNFIEAPNVRPEQWGRKLGVLKPYEEMAAE